MFAINDTLSIPEEDIEFSAIRAQGAGGQNVNKVSSAVHLRFDIPASSLPAFCKERLLALSDKRITKEGVIVIKAQTARTQERNREDALQRLRELLLSVLKTPPPRRPTKPSRSARRKRVDSKVARGRVKSLRKPLKPE
ncbi:alternative ribosome rescue aminoacyl-tRNA hydrolase ArfB [Mangrovitalea sediminis]|uniref:alternative ribosome rescue aminoacyl-tRNA hydrolase ArfB n=1 Tax=Mangrovitalea sediminis TaxID=1982043 RepID=UPI000BE55744|nr:alternative ribosome rescue aminoacyl-tRNA hydrolase ArfB [Mangrovitalea sediminis]